MKPTTNQVWHGPFPNGCCLPVEGVVFLNLVTIEYLPDNRNSLLYFLMSCQVKNVCLDVNKQTFQLQVQINLITMTTILYVLASFRDPSGTTITVKNFRINVSDVNSRPPQPTMARKFLNESVSSHVNERTTNVDICKLYLGLN